MYHSSIYFHHLSPSLFCIVILQLIFSLTFAVTIFAWRLLLIPIFFLNRSHVFPFHSGLQCSWTIYLSVSPCLFLLRSGTQCVIFCSLSFLNYGILSISQSPILLSSGLYILGIFSCFNDARNFSLDFSRHCIYQI